MASNRGVHSRPQSPQGRFGAEEDDALRPEEEDEKSRLLQTGGSRQEGLEQALPYLEDWESETHQGNRVVSPFECQSAGKGDFLEA